MFYTHDMDLGSAMVGGLGMGYGYGYGGMGMMNPYVLGAFANGSLNAPAIASKPQADVYVSHHKKDNTAEVILTGAAVAGVSALLVATLLKKPSQAAQKIRTIFTKGAPEVHVPAHTPSPASAPHTPSASSAAPASPASAAPAGATSTPVVPAHTPSPASAPSAPSVPSAPSATHTPSTPSEAPVVPTHTPSPASAAPTTPATPATPVSTASTPVPARPATPAPAAPVAPATPASSEKGLIRKVIGAPLRAIDFGTEAISWGSGKAVDGIYGAVDGLRRVVSRNYRAECKLAKEAERPVSSAHSIDKPAPAPATAGKPVTPVSTAVPTTPVAPAKPAATTPASAPAAPAKPVPAARPAATPATPAAPAPASSAPAPTATPAKSAGAVSHASQAAAKLTELDELGFKYVDTLKLGLGDYYRKYPKYKDMPKAEFDQFFENEWTNTLRNKQLENLNNELERFFNSCINENGGTKGSFGFRGIKSDNINEYFAFAKAKANAMGYELKNIRENDHNFINYDLEKIQSPAITTPVPAQAPATPIQSPKTAPVPVAKPSTQAIKPNVTPASAPSAKLAGDLSKIEIDELGLVYVDKMMKDTEKTYQRNTPKYKVLSDAEYEKWFEGAWASTLRDKKLAMLNSNVDDALSTCITKRNGQNGTFGFLGWNSKGRDEYLAFASAKAKAMGYDIEFYKNPLDVVNFNLRKIESSVSAPATAAKPVTSTPSTTVRSTTLVSTVPTPPVKPTIPTSVAPVQFSKLSGDALRVAEMEGTFVNVENLHPQIQEIFKNTPDACEVRTVPWDNAMGDRRGDYFRILRSPDGRRVKEIRLTSKGEIDAIL